MAFFMLFGFMDLSATNLREAYILLQKVFGSIWPNEQRIFGKQADIIAFCQIHGSVNTLNQDSSKKSCPSW